MYKIYKKWGRTFEKAETDECPRLMGKIDDNELWECLQEIVDEITDYEKEYPVEKNTDKNEIKLKYEDNCYIIYAEHIKMTGDQAINKLLSEDELTLEEVNKLRKIAREDEDGTWFESRC